MSKILGKLKRILLKEELESLNETSGRFVEAYKQLQKENEKQKKQYDNIKAIFDFWNGECSIVGYAKDKLNEDVWVVKTESDRDLTLYLYGDRYTHPLPRILCTKTTDRNDNRMIRIDDFFAETENIGNGSILIKFLLTEAKKYKAASITGMLSHVDSDHFDKLEHFYEKNGFAVSFNDTRTEGSIKKTL